MLVPALCVCNRFMFLCVPQKDPRCPAHRLHQLRHFQILHSAPPHSTLYDYCKQCYFQTRIDCFGSTLHPIYILLLSPSRACVPNVWCWSEQPSIKVEYSDPLSDQKVPDLHICHHGTNSTNISILTEIGSFSTLPYSYGFANATRCSVNDVLENIARSHY